MSMCCSSPGSSIGWPQCCRAESPSKDCWSETNWAQSSPAASRESHSPPIPPRPGQTHCIGKHPSDTWKTWLHSAISPCSLWSICVFVGWWQHVAMISLRLTHRYSHHLLLLLLLISSASPPYFLLWNVFECVAMPQMYYLAEVQLEGHTSCSKGSW